MKALPDCTDCRHHKDGLCHEPRALEAQPKWIRPHPIEVMRKRPFCGLQAQWFEKRPEPQPSYADPWKWLLLLIALAVAFDVVHGMWREHG